MYTKIVSLVLVVITTSFFVIPSLAQDDWQTYESEDEAISFTYPAGWYVFTEDFNSQLVIVNDLALVNRQVFDITQNIDEDQLGIVIGSLKGVNAGNISIEGLPNSAEFNLALASTSLIISAQLVNQLYNDNQAATVYFDEFETLEINGYDTAQIKASFLDQAFWFIVIDYDGNLLGFTIRTPLGEIDDHQDLILSIIESIEYTPSIQYNDTTTSFNILPSASNSFNLFEIK